MSTLSYDKAKKKVYFGMLLLGAVTVVEVIFSLFGKGHIFGGLGVDKINWVAYVIGVILIALSLYKAYYIIFEFMHMKYEVKSLALSVLLPTTLLIWAIIAFFQEGDSWKNRRERIQEFNQLESEESSSPQGMLLDESTYRLLG